MNYNFRVFFSVLMLTLFAGIHVAQADWLEFFSFLAPRVEKNIEPNPALTLMAPFADQDAVLDIVDPTGNKELAVPLEERHRPNTEISRWVQINVPSLMAFHADKYRHEYEEKIKFFSKVGAEEYVSFLRNNNIIKTLQTGRYDVAAIVDGYPVIINEGAVDGRYRWLYQVNVMLTFMDKKMTRYSRSKKGDTITKNFVLTTQLGRVRGADNEHGVLIETWGVKAVD